MRKNSFTLIELLVVVSIIGVLSSIIVVSTSAVRTKARNNAIKANLNSLRQAGELWYSSYDTYDGFCVNNNCADGSPDWKMVCSAVKIQNGNQDIICNSTATAWCVSTALVGGGNYCVDSKAVAKEAACVGTACP